MASSKITFADKVSSIISSLPIINRIRADDVNEIKQVVNSHADDIDTANSKITSLETTVQAIKLAVQVTSDTKSLTVGALTQASGSKTLTNAGYFPTGVAGIKSSNTKLTLSDFYMSAEAEGTCTINYTFNNSDPNSQNGTITMYVNWAKIKEVEQQNDN